MAFDKQVFKMNKKAFVPLVWIIGGIVTIAIAGFTLFQANKTIQSLNFPWYVWALIFIIGVAIIRK